MENTPRYAEFFCGGGMVRAALGAGWSCGLANDIDPMKCAVYRKNWGRDGLWEGDIAALDLAHLKQPYDLYWASSPCQDFSLAGKGQGLRGRRSGVFETWFAKIEAAARCGFAPRIIAFENVTGLISRAQGADFAHVLKRFISLGYRVGALEIDARDFVPQSRVRVFVIAVLEDCELGELAIAAPTGPYHTDRLRRFIAGADELIRQNWLWWQLERPDSPARGLDTLLDRRPDTPWFSEAEVTHLLSMMSPPSLGRVEAARRAGGQQIGMLYRRGRPDASGVVRQRAEVRFDGLAGCLRTPAGGSSRQTVLLVKGNQTRARLLSRRELAGLMGLPRGFKMPAKYNDAYRVAGDGVVVDVVAHLYRDIFQPLLKAKLATRRVA